MRRVDVSWGGADPTGGKRRPGWHRGCPVPPGLAWDKNQQISRIRWGLPDSASRSADRLEVEALADVRAVRDDHRGTPDLGDGRIEKGRAGRRHLLAAPARAADGLEVEPQAVVRGFGGDDRRIAAWVIEPACATPPLATASDVTAPAIMARL